MALLDATERKVLVVSTFISGVICLFPMEWVSGVALLVLSGIFFALDQRVSSREAEAAQGAASPAVAAPAAAEGGEIAPSPEAG